MSRIGMRFCLVVGGFALAFSALILYRAWAEGKRQVESETATKAELALAFDLAIREYVDEAVRPEVERRIDPDDFVLEAMSTSYAARQIVGKVRERFPNYLLRFPSENPRNPVNLANAPEMELLHYFRSNPDVDRWSGPLTLDGVRYYAQASPMRMEERCLRCHGDPADSPKMLLERYGTTGGFHHQVGELAGMDLMAVPMDPMEAAVASQTKGNLLALGIWLMALFATVFGAFSLIVGRRLGAITRHFQTAAREETGALVPVPESGRDEITVLAHSFNSLSSRLRGLHESLEEQVRQRTEELSAANEHLRREQRLLKQSLRMHDRERQVIAYEIHDGLAQHLVGADMAFQLGRPAAGAGPEQGISNYDAGMGMLQRCIAEARRLINGVRPPLLDEEGVVAAIKNLLTEDGNGGPEVEFHHSARIERMEPVLENAVYRIVQEAVTNARQHSGSEKVCVALTMEPDHVHIEVQDWGGGFDPAQKKGKAMGLRGIKKRAKLLGGKAKIDSAPGRGTHVTVDLPLVPPEDESEDSDF